MECENCESLATGDSQYCSLHEEMLGIEAPDTNQASELFELCKEVYEKTGWIVGYESWDWHTTTDAKLDSMFIAPKYYTDYLLEKLPRLIIKPKNVPCWLTVSTAPTIGGAAYVDGFGRGLHTCRSDTPLKALLKLTIALSEAGELNG